MEEEDALEILSTSREMDNLRRETMTGVNSRFVVKLLTFLECVVLSPSFYLLIQLFSSVSVDSGF